MEHGSSLNSSLNEPLTEKVTARAVMNKEIRKIQADKDKNIEKLDGISREISRIKKAVRKRRHKDRRHRAFSLKVNEVINIKTGIRNSVDALKQINSHIKEAKN